MKIEDIDVEKGNYTRVHNRILEELAKIQLSGHEWRIVITLWRKTYGWKKKEDFITNKQLQIMTGLSKVETSRSLSKLRERNIIIKNNNNNHSILRFNKYFTTWKQLSKMITVIKNDNTSYQKRQQQLSKMITHNAEDIDKKKHLGVPKETLTKETYTKERTTITSQIHNVIMQFPDNIKPLVFEYTDIMRLQNKTLTLSKHKEFRLVNELYLLWSQYQGNDIDEVDYRKALKITINNQAPNINYVRKVIQGIVNKRSIRMKRGK